MGRKRKIGAREKSGKLSRNPAEVEKRRKLAWDATQQDAVSVALEARQRLFGYSEENARDQKAGSFIGRLCIAKALNRSQYEALVMWEESARLNRMVSGGPTGDSAQDPNRVVGRAGEENIQRSAAIRQRHRAAELAVQERQNELRGSGMLFAALYECVERDREHYHLVGDVRHAANALIRHYGLGMEKAA